MRYLVLLLLTACVPVTATPSLPPATDTATATASATLTATASDTATASPTASATATHTATATRTPSPTRTATNTRTPSRTPSATATATVTRTPSATATGGEPTPRYFHPQSIWNAPAAGAVTHQNSAAWMARVVNEPYIDIVIDGVDSAWSVPIYEIGPNSVTRRVCGDEGGYCENVPFPADWRGASPDGDGKAVFIDAGNQLSWSFWRLICQSTTSCTAGYGAFAWTPISATGDGLTLYDGGQWAGRASSWHYLPGLILFDEVRAGRIEHSIAGILPGQVVSSTATWPARASDGYCASGCLPMGSRLVLDMTDAEIDALPLGTGGAVVAHAMQEFGIWIGDTGSQFGINAQEFLNASGGIDAGRWRGVLDFYALSNLPLERLRVVQVNRDDFYTIE